MKIEVYNEWDHVDKAVSEGKDNVVLAWDGEYRKGDMIEFSGLKPGNFYMLKVDAVIDPSLVLVDKENIIYTIPFYEKKTSYNPLAFVGNRHYISIREAFDFEVSAYRNLAHNPFDIIVGEGLVRILDHEVQGILLLAGRNLVTTVYIEQ